MVIVVFLAAVVVSALTFTWAVRPRIKYLRLRQERFGDVPPFLRPALVEEANRKPWIFPVRLGPLWRAQSTWDRAATSDPELETLKGESERRQSIALITYVSCLLAIFAAAIIRL